MEQRSHVTEYKSTSSAPLSSKTLSQPRQLESLPTPPQTPATEHPRSITKGNAHGNAIGPQSAEENPLASMHGQDPNTQSHANYSISIDSDPSQRSRQEYMDSLVPPSTDEMLRISQVQLEREKKEKRRSRAREKEHHKSLSLDTARASLDVASQKSPRRSIFSRHKKSASTGNTHSRNNSVSAAAIASVSAAGAELTAESVSLHRAATLIQRTYRGYRTRREMKGLGLNADTRWTHAMREMKYREMTRPRSRREDEILTGTKALKEAPNSPKGKAEAEERSNSARYKWRKIAVIAGRAAADLDDDPESSSSSDSDSGSDSGPPTAEKRKIANQKREEARARRRKDAQMMGLQYFLEMVDLKHRYGSNLRTYHEEWKKADTHENFFYWLDYGQGRNIDMTSCPRERLDREQVRYLSREERQYYLVKVDSEGRLCWAKNGARIDTTEKWKDSIHGIVPADDPTPPYQPKSTDPNHPRLFQSDTASSSSNELSEGGDASESELEAARAAKYASPGFNDAKGYKKVTRLSASTIFNTLLRRSVRKNTWIFVADTSFRLYVGIKDSGAFQHSSFLQGSRLSAAGLIKIRNGRLTSLSPLSGHYRPPASNFRAFVRSLKDASVDTSHVSISKSYAVLVGLETYVKTRRKGKRLVQKATHRKDKIIHPEEVQRREEESRDKSQSAEKERKFLEKQAEEDKRREENCAAVKVMQKLGMSPAVPEGQKNSDSGEGAEASTSQGGGGSNDTSARSVERKQDIEREGTEGGTSRDEVM